MALIPRSSRPLCRLLNYSLRAPSKPLLTFEMSSSSNDKQPNRDDKSEHGTRDQAVQTRDAVVIPRRVPGQLQKQMTLQNILIEVFLELEQLDTFLFRAHHLVPGLRHPPNQRVYGGQTMGQALQAACKTVPSEYHPHSMHCFFVKAGNIDKPMMYQVDPLQDGRSYCNRFVRAIQDGQVLFTAQLSFHKEEPDSIKHQVKMPQTPPPEECEDAAVVLENLVTSMDYTDERRAFWAMRQRNLPTTFEIKPTDPKAYAGLHAPGMSPETGCKFAAWIRTNESIGDDWRLHHSVAAFISDTSMVFTALLPHVAAGFKVGMVTTLNHCLWIHRYNFRIDDWMLYETESTVAAGARAMVFGRLWSRDGTLVMSTSQECLVRGARI